MLGELISRFRKTLSEKTLRIKGLNYTDKSVGLRTPDSPVGILCQDTGLVQIYAGRTKLITSINGLIALESPQINLSGHEIILNPSHIKNLKILGRNINPELFESKPVLTAEGLNGFYLVTDSTQVYEGRLINTEPLENVIKKINLFDRARTDTERLNKYKDICSAIGIELPKWIE